RFEDLRDPYGIEFWPKFKGRDGCRTPMIWSAEQQNAGFSNVKPWLPVPENHKLLAVDQQESDPGSLLHHYRQFLKFRHRNQPLVKGTIELETINEEVFSFYRRYGNESVYCVFNLSNEVQTIPRSAKRLTPLPDSGFGGTVEKQAIVVPALDAFFGLSD
ncbi:MAG: alpha-glucosidase, partial [Pseudomonadota bacterium]